MRALDFTAERRDEFAVPLDADPATWPIVVVLDHPGAAGVTMPPQENVFAITFDDWCELNRAVRSVNGLVQYVQRVLDAGTALDVPLGREMDRFRHVAATDAAYAAQRPGSLPWFTLDVARDRLGVKVYRELLERVWTGDARGAELTAAECRLVLDHLDNAPIGLQSRIGEWIFGKRDRLSTTGYRQSGVTVLDNGLLLYVCDSETNEPDRQMWAAELTALAAARRCTWREQRGAATAALAVGVRECTVGVEYTYVYLDGDVDISADLRAAVEGRYGTPSFTSR